MPRHGAREAVGAGLADPVFTEPFVDVDEWRDEPVRVVHVHAQHT